MWSYLTFLPEVADCLDIPSLLNHMSHKDCAVRWYAAAAVSKHVGLSEAETDALFRNIFKEEELRTVVVRIDKDLLKLRSRHRTNCSSLTVGTLKTSQAHTLQAVTAPDLSAGVVCVMGILLPKLDTGQRTSDEALCDLVPVASTQHHLRSLALAVSAGSPVLLQGPVGCGKTSLVEHLAGLTGRRGVPHLIKIQLGDQTDSKALLGTYCSTETPGEFVWRPGALTHAVTSGSWVLLEDVDTAPMDVISLLVALAETGALPLPGHGDEVRAVPGFQLFVTQRLLSSSEGLHRQLGSKSALLEKLCSVVNVEPLCRTELEQVVTSKFSALSPIVDRLLDIYFMLSSGQHDSEDGNSAGSVDRKLLSHGGRLISTSCLCMIINFCIVFSFKWKISRNASEVISFFVFYVLRRTCQRYHFRDLMNWCRRSSVDFDHRESSQGLKVFLEALDCFVTSLPKSSTRLAVATAIGTKLNVTEERAKYFCSQHKPSIRETQTRLEIGRSKLKIETQHKDITTSQAPVFSYTRAALGLLEKVAVCVQKKEPILLTGETGTGKTSTVQFLAHHLGHRLHVINLNQQSDSTDFLGGFKPVDFKLILMPVREEFETLFCQTFSRSQNEKFLSHIQTLFAKKQWSNLLTLIETPVKKALNKLDAATAEYAQWSAVLKRIHVLRVQIKEANSALAFSFLEGTLVKALRQGHWVLLDEINLASAETLDSLAGLLESPTGSVVLTERGDIDPVKRHPDFRLFACMNPATDVGKKDLPAGIRNRFTEFFVEELENSEDLSTLVRDYLQGLSLSPKQVTGIVKFYLTIRGEVADKLTDGTGHKPHYSLRTLCRALRYSARNPCRSVPRSLYEGFCLSFLSQLDRSSHPVVDNLICRHVLGSATSTATKAILSQKLPRPDEGVREGGGASYVSVADYWISRGRLKPSTPQDYILTPSVKLNLKDLARVVSAGRQPVLLQGETSVGKTSLVVYLSRLSGNVCVRVNNHEHTDLQEYIGSYVADEHGKLVFKEGVLVEAMRKGHWIILDELNLAPTDVLEALNRLLDHNQELFIPETQEVVQAHPKFQLFATQNPPGLYGGRKVLSRAFRNRFIELHFDEIPPKELETILHERCGIPLSFARKLVAVMLELQTRRRGSSIFSGKQGFMTLRDLFRWAQRYNCPEAGKGQKFYDWDQHLADHGYMLVAGRVRKSEEEQIVLEVLEKHLKRKVSPGSLFSVTKATPEPFAATLESVMGQSVDGFQHMVWTYSMRRLALLIGQAIRFQEPVLLVGSTGIGKTTVCQLYAALRGQALHSVNCHMHTESGDFLGGLRPVRSSSDDADLKEQKLFEWKDGPLVTAMKDGAMFLIDEISLADDSVLERLNSVLEPERTLVLAERGGLGESNEALSEVESVTAAESFRLFATMNPGGDFGKKELSPALRNRFTEIWCPPSLERQDLIAIVEKNIRAGLQLHTAAHDGSSGFGAAMIDFVNWFTATDFGSKATVSIRDLLSWVHFVNCCCGRAGDEGEAEEAMETDSSGLTTLCQLNPQQSYVHGACLVFVDSLGAGSTQSWNEAVAQTSRQRCLDFLLSQLSSLCGSALRPEDCGLLTPRSSLQVVISESSLSIPPFSIARGPSRGMDDVQFSLEAPTTCVNGQRLLRGLQLARPILLEGSPGVGKTSLVAAVARLARKTLIRVNLSEQTDVSDLFGADLPVEGEEGGRFAWRDGPFLQALKAGHWVVFDELNLASQSVLEGLNACFDHRSEVYIPELGKTFHINQEDTRIFACQNPLAQGGGRKGLPQSFLNRFTKVYVDPLTRTDLIFIASRMYPGLPEDMLTDMVDFNTKMYSETMVKKQWGGRGSPWEFNLRDLFRWCELMQADQNVCPGEYVGLIYKDRMRTSQDKLKVDQLYTASLGSSYPLCQPSRVLHVGSSTVQAGHSFLPRQGVHKSHSVSLLTLHHCLEPLESLMKCVQMSWLAILVGPQSCGKTSLVRLLAQLCGQTLSVLPMNSSMDTTELLGGFEQVSCWLLFLS
ncbi:midasin [Aplysia californica]|uniref:Midasin n=1 Tax=Aplysia californica TaxID=6500 RepID=A0ABM1VXH1_APLCA|nr:midasin [Aplysia californica]